MTWKEARKLSYLMYNFDDINLEHEYLNLSDEEIINITVNFFKSESKLIYPPKSYFVAIIYAHYISKYFNENFYELLDDEELLFDDKYFVIYSKKKYVYDEIISKIDNIEDYSSILPTLKYFNQEFLIEI
jgi:hypothetical protein